MLSEALTVFLRSAAPIALPVMLLALSVSIVAVIAGWRRRGELLDRQNRPMLPARIELGNTPFETGVLDIAAETAAVMRQFEGLAAERFVALELAVQPGLAVRADPPVLREILGELVARAIEEAPCGRVLLSAAHVDDRIRIAVSDDGAQTDRASRAERLRQAQRLSALQGATMDIDTRTGCGTTVVLQLPSGTSGRDPGDRIEILDPASVWGSA